MKYSKKLTDLLGKWLGKGSSAGQAMGSATADIERVMQEGLDAHRSGDARVARKHYERVLSVAPEHAGALYLLAQLALADGDWAGAENLCRRASASDATVGAIHVGLGQALQQQGRTADAMAAFRRALELEPESIDAWEGLAVALSRTRSVQEANECLRRWLQLKIRADRRSTAAARAPAEIADTTLVCIDCRYYELSANALARSLAQCRFERAIFLTDAEVRVEGVETVRIAPLASSEDYSRFVMKDLDRYIGTAFALLVQYDGYVLSGARWSAEFQSFDYVGAPWFYRDGMSVGNGGFSLRSKRLLQALQDPQIEFTDPEDLAICRKFRPLLEQRHGIRFAPQAVAERFSFETLPPSEPTFGFHGLGHLYYLFDMSESEIEAYVPAPLDVVER